MTYTNGAVTEEEENSLCKDDDSFKCDVTMTECIDPGLTCNGVAECRTGYDESVEICGESWNFVLFCSFFLFFTRVLPQFGFFPWGKLGSLFSRSESQLRRVALPNVNSFLN